MLNLFDIMVASDVPVEEVVIIRHSFNRKETKDIWDKNDRRFFEEYQSLQPSEYFFKGKRLVLSFVADGRTHSRFVGCYEIVGLCPANQVERLAGFPCMDFYDRPGHVYFKMVLSEYMKDLKDRLVIDWPGTRGYVQYSRSALERKTIVSIYPDSSHVFPGYNYVLWDYVTLQSYMKNLEKYEEIENALKQVYAVYLVTDPVAGKFYVGSAYGKDGLLGRWRTYANTKGRGGNLDDGNQGIVEYLNLNLFHQFHLKHDVVCDILPFVIMLLRTETLMIVVIPSQIVLESHLVDDLGLVGKVIEGIEYIPQAQNLTHQSDVLLHLLLVENVGHSLYRELLQ